MNKSKYKVYFKGTNQNVIVRAWSPEQAVILAQAERIEYGCDYTVTGYEELD